MRKILEYMVSQAVDWDKESYILATIVKAQGSTPRKVGAMMLIGREGILEGTIGGGLLEHQCMVKGQSLLGESVGTTETYILDNTKAQALGMICGGTTDIRFTILRPEMKSVIEKALQIMGERGKGYFCLSYLEDEISVEDQPIEDKLCIPLVSGNRIFLLGGGHVAMEVGKLLDYLNFRYILVDDREEFATEDRFPQAELRIVASFESLKENRNLEEIVPITKQDAFCIMTRGHMGDINALRFALDTDATYIGVMGSKRKRELVMKMLEEEGNLEVRDRVTTPIGLKIGAQTPEELAISVVGELIRWRAERQ